MMSVVVTIVGYAHHHRVVDVTIEVPSFHWWIRPLNWKLLGVPICMCMRVGVWVCVIGVILLRRIISMVNLLIGLWHPVIRIINRWSLVSSLLIRVVWGSKLRLVRVLVVEDRGADLLSRVLNKGMVR